MNSALAIARRSLTGALLATVAAFLAFYGQSVPWRVVAADPAVECLTIVTAPAYSTILSSWSQAYWLWRAVLPAVVPIGGCLGVLGAVLLPRARHWPGALMSGSVFASVTVLLTVVAAMVVVASVHEPIRRWSELLVMLHVSLLSLALYSAGCFLGIVIVTRASRSRSSAPGSA